MYRLIYKSRSKTPADWGLVNSIIGSSQEGNSELDVSGVLLATKSYFLQGLEGSFEKVNELYYTIVKDPRHDRVQLISFTCAEERIFRSWTMHGIGVFNFNRELAERLRQTYGEEGGDVRLPTEEWQALALIADIRRSES
ncbi:MAG: BLUF domain-containing protein [Gammaproteobacteria bacterium]|nr:BLUF domain-containing protein [Gammaproteobacteria bacterium]